ncbi:hypothetical protein HYH03_014567 [Edaphochlamys debaryana]|uniref:Uncharacterized protein n=1 Tax=Edaphochlamys debaryana TaxID=47281 RepID=A0A835XMF5_9CHLO|nr:hypothetical protein HYH03_014567 [Edaphochlamys debaryana]|eukprot:KAG2486768.1 hypothetical protein HYH03_014567 [Edaphochlamys debaryana]
MARCPGSSYAVRADLRLEAPQDSGPLQDDTAANSVRLGCSDGTVLAPNDGYWGSWQGWKSCAAGQYLCGMRVRYEAPLLAGDDDTTLNGLQIAGEWRSWRYCLAGSERPSFIFGLKLRVEAQQSGTGDDTALNGIAIACSPVPGGTELVVEAGDWGTWSAMARCPGNSYAVRADLRLEAPQGSGPLQDDTAANSVRLGCSDGTVLAPNDGYWGSWQGWKSCAAGQYLCGMRVRYEGSGVDDDTTLNGLQIACCGLQAIPPSPSPPPRPPSPKPPSPPPRPPPSPKPPGPPPRPPPSPPRPPPSPGMYDAHICGFAWRFTAQSLSWLKGEWRSWRYCLAGSERPSFIFGLKLRVEAQQSGTGDDTALNGIAIACSPVPGGTELVVEAGDWGTWSAMARCPGNSYAVRADLRLEAPQGSGPLQDDTAANSVRLGCSDGTVLAPNDGYWGSWQGWKSCAAGQYLCGMRVRYEGSGVDDDTTLNGLQIACCGLQAIPPSPSPPPRPPSPKPPSPPPRPPPSPKPPGPPPRPPPSPPRPPPSPGMYDAHICGFAWRFTAQSLSWLKGEWRSWRYCLAGSERPSFIFGLKLRVEAQQSGTGDDTALNGIAIACSPVPGGTELVVEAGDWGAWSAMARCPGNSYAVRADLRLEAPQGSGPLQDDTAANSVRLGCSDGTVLAPNDGYWGSWQGWKSCAAGQYLCGMRVRGDDTALNGIAIACSPVPGGTELVVEAGDWGMWSAMARCPGNSYAVGADLRLESAQAGSDDTAANSVRLKCSDDTVLAPNDGYWGSWQGWKSCAAGQYLCGMRVRYEGSGVDDDTTLNGLQIACCYLPASG